MKYKLLLLFIPILFFACGSDKKPTEVTYFGGKIINPKDSKVFFYKGESLLDSVSLSNKNKFLFKFDSIKEGLYTFRHDGEYQVIFLEPTDSLLLRLNTWDFDESLVYSGKGAEKNNLLIQLFLVNEKDNKLFYNYYSLNDSLFNIKIDSLMKIKENMYNHYKEEDPNPSKLYSKYVQAFIKLPLYTQKEKYPYLHKKALGLKEYPHVNPKFYKYRKSINLNDKDLSVLYNYHNYVKKYLSHISYEKELLHGEGSPMVLNFLEAVKDNITLNDLKNRLLDDGIWSAYLNGKLNEDQRKKAQEIFFNHCSDHEFNKEVKQMIKASESLKKGDKLPSLIALNTRDNKVFINDVIKKSKTVIYFWPKEGLYVDYMAKRVQYLKKEFPNILFIGIDATHSQKKWKSLIKSNKLSLNKQFKLDLNSTNDWLHLDHSRAIIVNNKGVIENGFTHLNSESFKQQLLKLEKQ